MFSILFVAIKTAESGDCFHTFCSISRIEKYKIKGLGLSQNTKTERFGGQPERSVFPVWVLTGFACYSARKSRLTYAGLLACRECGNAFILMIRCWNGKSRVEYVCRGYHRNGKSYCSSHRIHEEVLDEQVQACAETVREQCAEEVEKLAQLQKMWALRKPILDAHILSLQGKVQVLEQEIDEIVMEKIIHQT